MSDRGAGTVEIPAISSHITTAVNAAAATPRRQDQQRPDGAAARRRDKFVGAMLGLMTGDTFGAPVEGWPSERINETLRVVESFPHNSPYRALYDNVLGVLSGRVAAGRGHYTDDTQMAIGVAESLLACGDFDGEDMGLRLAHNFDGRRAYGPGVYSVLQNLRRGVPWEEAGTRLFGGEGSLGNGGAVRVAPVALLYHTDPECLRRNAALSASITHTHALGREGAALLASAVALAVTLDPAQPFDANAFLLRLRYTLPDATATARTYLTALDAVSALMDRRPSHREVADALGCGIEAPRSVPTALYAFLAHPDSFKDAVMFAVRVGGDADTIGAMTGALAGAYHGESGIPEEWRRVLEAETKDGKGVDYVRDLAERLYALWQLREGK